MPEQQATQTEPKVFNFDDAVAEAKKSFPKETEDIVFINSSAPDFEEKLAVFAQEAGLSPNQHLSLLTKGQNQEAVASVYNGHKIITIPADREEGQFPGDKYKSAYFVFQHELGHFVVPGAHAETGNRDTNWREHAADFFAMTRGVQAGIFNEKDVVDQATNRSMMALLAYADITHLTTMSLDSMVINPKDADFLTLSNKEIKSIAKKHASAFSHDGDTESKFAKVRDINRDFRRKDQQFESMEELEHTVHLRLKMLCDICKESPSNSQAFYLSARILDRVIEQGGVKVRDFGIEVDTNTKEWQNMKSVIAAKSGERDIGAKNALEESSFTKAKEKNDAKTPIARVRTAIKPLKI